MQEPHRRGRVTLIVLALLFIGPLAAAWLMYFGVPDWRSNGSAAHGDLIDPPPLLPAVSAMRASDGAAVDIFRERWTLIYVSANGCDRACVDTLAKIRQVHIALGKNMDRVQRTLLLLDRALADSGMLSELPGLSIADAPLTVTNALRSANDDDPAQVADRWIYLADPLGNLMLRFDRDVAPADMHKDLKRLLRVSRIG